MRLVNTHRRAIVLIIGVVGAVAVPAAAHTEVQSAEPGPGDEVSGPVEGVSLTFLDQVATDATIDVSGPDGPIESSGPATLDDTSRVLELDLEPVSQPGDYVVRYSFTATDGDRQDESYRFRIVEDESSVPIGAVVAAGAAVLVIAAALWRRRRGATDA